METIDPTTGQKLPPDAIQRVLFIATNVHIYQIPPLSSNKGYSAAEWTDEKRSKKIFTGRMRLLETAVPKPAASTTTTPTTTTPEQPSEDVKVDLLVEDPATGELFAAAPYTSPAVVEQAIDSSRFFAVQFRNQGMKATLGIGFEERSEAMDFNISLQDARKVLGFELPKGGGGGSNGSSSGSARPSSKSAAEEKKDFSLKEGETITVNIGGRGRRNRNSSGSPPGEENKDAQAALFSIKPPPASGGGGGPVPFLPPPPSASSVKAERRRSRPLPPQGAMPPAEKQPSPQELGFDDGEFGEFQ